MKAPIAGAMAGAIATVPMTAVMLGLHRQLPASERYALPPREIVGKVLAPIAQERQLTSRQVTATTLLAHFGYGAATGSLYGLLFPAVRPPLWSGPAYGVAVWALSYCGWIPAARLLKPANRHPRRRNGLMILAHLVWGSSLAAAYNSCATHSRD